MKNIFKYISLAAISAFAMTACSEDGPDYAGPGAFSDAPGVVFASSAASSYVLTPTETVLNIPVSRTNAASAGSYDVTVVKNQDNALIVPTQVSFAAGEKSALLPIGIASSFEVGTTKALELSLSADLKSPYTNGSSVLVTKVTRDYVWNDLGVATMEDGWLGAKMESHLYQRSDDASYYRLAFPYDDDAYADGGADDMVGGYTQEFIEFTVVDGVVTWEQWYTGLTYDGSEEQSIVAFQPSYLSSSLTDENTVVYYNEDGSISYIAFSPYYYVPGVGGWGEIETDLYWPGYEFAEEEEPEEEVGQDFFAGAAFADYLGTYTMTYKESGKEYSEDVTISDNGNGTVTISSFSDGVSFVANYFAGLLYLGSQDVVIPDYEEYNFGLYMADEEGNLYDDVYFYAGFDENGVLKFKNYPYNVTVDEDGNLVPASKMDGIYVVDLAAGAWGYYTDMTFEKQSANKSAKLVKTPKARRLITNAKVVGSAPSMMAR